MFEEYRVGVPPRAGRDTECLADFACKMPLVTQRTEGRGVTWPCVNAKWNSLHTLLAEALSELDEWDRDAIALRFFENRTFAKIGALLRLDEDGVRKRLERTLTKLGSELSRYGFNATTTTLSGALATFGSIPAPAGLASSVTAKSLAAARLKRSEGRKLLKRRKGLGP